MISKGTTSVRIKKTRVKPMAVFDALNRTLSLLRCELNCIIRLLKVKRRLFFQEKFSAL